MYRAHMVRKARGPITASELLEELESDPEWVAARERQERERLAQVAVWRKAEQPLVRELQEAGCKVETAWDLVNTAQPYPDVLPVLLEHLGRPYPDRVREGIARALAVRRDARFAWPALVSLYRREPAGTDTKHGLAAALAAISDRSTLPELIELVEDRRHGASRVLLIRGLTRSRQPEARAAVARLQDDPEVGEEARHRVAARAGR
jgi:hypothetical protein